MKQPCFNWRGSPGTTLINPPPPPSTCIGTQCELVLSDCLRIQAKVCRYGKSAGTGMYTCFIKAHTWHSPALYSLIAYFTFLYTTVFVPIHLDRCRKNVTKTALFQATILRVTLSIVLWKGQQTGKKEGKARERTLEEHGDQMVQELRILGRTEVSNISWNP